MRTHKETEVSRVQRCHMDYDQPDGCPLCIAERRANAAESALASEREAHEATTARAARLSIRLREGMDRLAAAEEAMREQEKFFSECAAKEGNPRWKNVMLSRARDCRAFLAGGKP